MAMKSHSCLFLCDLLHWGPGRFITSLCHCVFYDLHWSSRCTTIIVQSTLSLSTFSRSAPKKIWWRRNAVRSQVEWKKTSHTQNLCIGPLSDSWWTLDKNDGDRTRDIDFPFILLSYLKLVPALPTMQQFGQRLGYDMSRAGSEDGWGSAGCPSHL